jgi:Tfp pilus assembly protein PilF
MFEPTTLLYALVGALGLIGADAYYNSSTLHIETSVAPVYEARGYSQKVVESIFAGELENIASTPSIITRLEFVTSKHKPVSSALAEAAHLNEPFEAAKAAVGISYSTVLASIVVDTIDGKDFPRIVVTGNTENLKHFSLTVPLTSSSSVDLALSEAAFRTMQEINPYLTALYAFSRAEKNGVHPSQADALVSEWIENAPTSVYSPERAQFENLRGLSSLIDNDPIAATAWFNKANKSDPDLQTAIINLAFMAKLSGDNERAVELCKQIIDSSFWSGSANRRLVYAANVGLGWALASQGKFEESDYHFAEAIAMLPNGVAGYYYWARALIKQDRSAEAKALVETAMRNAKKIVNNAELASLYFWLPDGPDGVLERRTKDLPKVFGALLSPSSTSQ